MLKKTTKGHNYIEVTYSDMTLKLNGGGICDSCSPPKMMQHGYLIPVLNAVYCEHCFNRWRDSAEYYEEDREYEAYKTEGFIKALK